MKVRVIYTKRVHKQNWAHGSRTVDADTYEEAELIVRQQLLEERKTILCVSAIRSYKLEVAV